MQGAQVQPLIRELRSHVPWGAAKKKKKKMLRLKLKYEYQVSQKRSYFGILVKIYHKIAQICY